MVQASFDPKKDNMLKNNPNSHGLWSTYFPPRGRGHSTYLVSNKEKKKKVIYLPTLKYSPMLWP